MNQSQRLTLTCWTTIKISFVALTKHWFGKKLKRNLLNNFYWKTEPNSRILNRKPIQTQVKSSSRKRRKEQFNKKRMHFQMNHSLQKKMQTNQYTNRSQWLPQGSVDKANLHPFQRLLSCIRKTMLKAIMQPTSNISNPSNLSLVSANQQKQDC